MSAEGWDKTQESQTLPDLLINLFSPRSHCARIANQVYLLAILSLAVHYYGSLALDRGANQTSYLLLTPTQDSPWKNHHPPEVPVPPFSLHVISPPAPSLFNYLGHAHCLADFGAPHTHPPSSPSLPSIAFPVQGTEPRPPLQLCPVQETLGIDPTDSTDGAPASWPMVTQNVASARSSLWPGFHNYPR
jgi:hypothetical protein